MILGMEGTWASLLSRNGTQETDLGIFLTYISGSLYHFSKIKKNKILIVLA